MTAISHNIMGRRSKKIKHDGRFLLLLMVPFIIFIFAFSYVPLFGWLYAFFEYKPGVPPTQSTFIGLIRFAAIFRDPDFTRVMTNTFVMSFLTILSSVFPVIFALLFNELRHPWLKKIIQTLTTLPNFISWITVYALAFAMFASDGVVTGLLQKVGISPVSTNILGNNDVVWIFQTALSVWKTVGWGAILYLAAIVGIDSELYDAAQVDGANRFQQILHVTLPGLASTYIVLLLLAISNILNNGFDQYFVFYNPLVADRMEVLDYYVYKIGILTNDYSLSTALGMFKGLISILLLFFVNFLSKKFRGDYII